MKVAMESENPTCMKISVILLFRIGMVAPYRDTSGIISTWNGMTMEAIIPENRSVHAFHLLRTITNAAMDENSMVSTVALTVIISEFLKQLQKFIFLIAFGKFSSVKP